MSSAEPNIAKNNMTQQIDIFHIRSLTNVREMVVMNTTVVTVIPVKKKKIIIRNTSCYSYFFLVHQTRTRSFNYT